MNILIMMIIKNFKQLLFHSDNSGFFQASFCEQYVNNAPKYGLAGYFMEIGYCWSLCLQVIGLNGTHRLLCLVMPALSSSCELFH